MNEKIINLSEFRGLNTNEISLVKLYWKLCEKKLIKFTCMDSEPITNKGLAKIMESFIKIHPEYAERR